MPRSGPWLGKPESLTLGAVWCEPLKTLLYELFWTFRACGCVPGLPFNSQHPHPIISPVIVQLQNPLAQATRGSLSIRPVPIEYSSRLSKSSMSQCHWAVLTFCKLWIADNMQTLSSRDLIDFLYFPIKTEPHNFGTYLINAVTLLKLSVFSKFSIIPAFFSIWLPFLWICFSNYSPSCLTWHQQSYNRITQNLIQSLGCLATALIPPNLKQPVSWNSMTWCKLWRSLLPSWPCMDQNSPWAIHLHH